MPFNVDRFDNAEFKPRTKEVSLPSLKAFFDKDELPIFEVRGLNSNELHRAVNASQSNKQVSSIVTAIAESADQAAAIRKAIGLGEEVPGEVAKRMEMLKSGLVSPELGMGQVVKFAETFPIEFMQLTNEITELTGLGYEEVKRSAASRKKAI